MRVKKETEASFARAVIAFARLHNWRCAHFRPSRTKTGWRTAVQGDGAGFVDLVLVRDRVIFAELKTDTGRLRAGQQEWLDWIRAAGADAQVWRPRDWSVIERLLQSAREIRE